MKKQGIMLLGVVVMAGAVVAVAGCGRKSDTEPGESLTERAGTAWDAAAEKTKEATGAVVEKTGEVLEGAGAAIESAGAGMRDDKQDETAEE